MLPKEDQELDIIRMGHPILREIAEDVPHEFFGSPLLKAFGKRLIKEMFSSDGVGLAAPQLAVSLRCLAYCVPKLEDEKEKEEGVEPTILVNPKIGPISQEGQEGWEGCLSLPGMQGIVPRYASIEVNAFDMEGKALHFEAHDFHARVIQHEYDHLDGILFIDRAKKIKPIK